MTSSDTGTTHDGRTAGIGPGFNAICDMCGQPVSKDDYYTTELTAQGATCPTMMTMHQACYEAAAALWVPEGPDSTCRVDPLFPETSQWNRMQEVAEEIDG